MTSPQLATLAYLQDALANQDTWAVVSQDAYGNLQIAAEIGPGSQNLGLNPLVGQTGPAGTAQFPLMLQEEVFNSPADLPTDLTNTAADVGRYWIIDVQDAVTGAVYSTGAYIWFGTEFRFLPFGNEGPPGAYGIISPFVTLLPPDNASQPIVTGSGTSDDPYLFNLELSVPAGPAGPCCPVAKMVDFDESVPPTVGQFITATGETVEWDSQTLALWAPANVGDVVPQCYTVPQSAFTASFGITFASYVTIATFSVPPNAWAWKPVVFGCIQMFEAELSLNPLQIGVEVYLGSPNPAHGTLVARGYGNTPGGVVTIVPHTSSASSPTMAMTPWNSVGKVAANAGGSLGTLYVNLVNDGIAAVWDYSPQGAELFVMACPATSQAALDLTVYGSLSPKVFLQAYVAVDATAVVKGKGTLSSVVEYWPQQTEFTSVGTFSYTPPSWFREGTDYLDLVVCSAGGGASTAGNNLAGGPGGAGSWATASIQTISSGSLTVTVPAGGKGSTTTAGGVAGGNVTIKDGATTKVSATGGAGGTYEGGGSVNGTAWHGPSPGNETFEGFSYYGGAVVTSNGGNGMWPGGGGAGADEAFVFGGHGASGFAAIVARRGA